MSPWITAVGLFGSAANTASSHLGSSAASLAIQPRSPPAAAVESVETAFATSSHFLPPVVTSVSAWSAIFFAAAFCSSVGSVLPSLTSGRTPMIQAWRCSGVVDSSAIFASIWSGVTLTPASLARSAWIRPSISCSRTWGASVWVWACCWSDWICVWPWELVRRPAATAAVIRACCCWSRQTSIDAASLKSSRVIVWPPTVAAAARCSP